MYKIEDYDGMSFSVAMTEKLHNSIYAQIYKGAEQEDLVFGLYKFYSGKKRFTAVLQKILCPREGERMLYGKAAFKSEYLQRVLSEAGKSYGIVFMHSHLGPGWQDMSDEDIIAERERLASAVAGRTGLPLLGMTMGTDGAWSGRIWLRAGWMKYEKTWVKSVRVVGKTMRLTYFPEIENLIDYDTQIATISVWGEENQKKIAKTHVGIIGLGSVGSIVAEALSRIGVSHITLIDFDVIKDRNLDRTLGAVRQDAEDKTAKVRVSERVIKQSHTSPDIDINICEESLLKIEGYKNALDCDVLFSCVDRPWPRWLLNTIAYNNLIPVIEGGIYAKVNEGKLINADWRINAIGPERPCMVCLGALNEEHVEMDMAGQLDDPLYIQGLPVESLPHLARQNVFPFSMSVAAHEVLQFIGVVTGKLRVGGMYPQFYHCYPGKMDVNRDITKCQNECKYHNLEANAEDLSCNLEEI